MSDMSKRIVRFGTIGLGILLIVIFAFSTMGKYNNYVEKSGNYDLQVADLQKQLLIQKAQADELTVDVSATRSNVHSLNNVGYTIANLQNDLVSQLNRYSTAQYNEISTLDASVQGYLQTLSEYFSDTSVRPWYQWDDQVLSPAWVCVTNYDFYGNTFDVLWICKCYQSGLSGEYTLAVATATYHDDTQRFSDLEVYVTDIGQTHMRVSKGGV